MGLEIGGWLLESGNLWDPSKGESLSHVAVIAQLAPSLHMNRGRLRDIDNALVTEPGLRYSVWDVRLGLTKELGRASGAGGQEGQRE